MFNINEFIVYNSQCVCQVEEICEQEMGGEICETYVLNPILENNCRIRIPVKTTKVSMRKIAKSDEALEIIESIPKVQTFWFEDKFERERNYKDAVRSGNSTEWLKVAKALETKKHEKQQEGKKLSNADENILNTVRNLLAGELSASLGIPFLQIANEVKSKIMACI